MPERCPAARTLFSRQFLFICGFHRALYDGIFPPARRGCRSGIEALKLHIVVTGVKPVLFHQFMMAAALYDSLVTENDDFIRVADRGKPVGDHDGGPVLGQLLQALLNVAFAFVIQSGGRFVQDQDPGILQENAGDRDPLFLPAGETGSPFSHKGIVTVRQRDDKVMDVGPLGGFYDLFIGGAGLSVGDIVPDASAEHVYVLLQILLRRLLSVMPRISCPSIVMRPPVTS